MKQVILQSIAEVAALRERFIRENLDLIIEAAERMAQAFASGHKILIFGNGGSASDAQHLAAEFVNRFQMERPPLAAVALTTDTSVITSIANDCDFGQIFRKQVLALGKKDDIALGISTSGNSENVIQAVNAAKEIQMFTVVFTGAGGKLAQGADLSFAVPSQVTAHVQEVHLTLEHLLCDLVERILFREK